MSNDAFFMYFENMFYYLLWKVIFNIFFCYYHLLNCKHNIRNIWNDIIKSISRAFNVKSSHQHLETFHCRQRGAASTRNGLNTPLPPVKTKSPLRTPISSQNVPSLLLPSIWDCSLPV